MEKPRYAMSVNTQGVGFRGGLNGVPIERDLDGEGLVTNAPLNAWIMPEENVFFADLFWPPRLPYAPGQARMAAMVFLCDPDAEYAKPGQVLAEFAWPLPDGPEEYPYRHRQEIEETYPVPTQLWGEAERIETLSAADRSAIVALVGRLREAFEAKDVDAAYDILRYRSHELARAEYHEDMDEIEGIDKEQMGWMLGQPELVASPWGEGTAAFEVVAQDHLVHVMRKDETPAFNLANERFTFDFEIYAARVGGEWIVAR